MHFNTFDFMNYKYFVNSESREKLNNYIYTCTIFIKKLCTIQAFF